MDVSPIVVEFQVVEIGDSHTAISLDRKSMRMAAAVSRYKIDWWDLTPMENRFPREEDGQSNRGKHTFSSCFVAIRDS